MAGSNDKLLCGRRLGLGSLLPARSHLERVSFLLCGRLLCILAGALSPLRVSRGRLHVDIMFVFIGRPLDLQLQLLPIFLVQLERLNMAQLSLGLVQKEFLVNLVHFLCVNLLLLLLLFSVLMCQLTELPVLLLRQLNLEFLIITRAICLSFLSFDLLREPDLSGQHCLYLRIELLLLGQKAERGPPR